MHSKIGLRTWKINTADCCGFCRSRNSLATKFKWEMTEKLQLLHNDLHRMVAIHRMVFRVWKSDWNSDQFATSTWVYQRNCSFDRTQEGSSSAFPSVLQWFLLCAEKWIPKILKVLNHSRHLRRNKARSERIFKCPFFSQPGHRTTNSHIDSHIHSSLTMIY